MSSAILIAEKLAEIEALLRTCNAAMLDAADALKAQAAEIERLTREMNEAHALIPSSSVELVSKNGEKRSLPWRIDMLMPAIAIGEKMLAKMVRGEKTIEGEFSELQARATAAEAKVAALEADKASLERALIEMRDRDDRNGSLPPAYRAIIDATLSVNADGIRAALGAKP